MTKKRKSYIIVYMKGIIKKRIKNLAIALSCATLISLGVGYYVNTAIIPEKIHKDNSSIEQIDQYQEEFDVVSGYRHSNGERLQHNDGEPIYIQIDDEFSLEQKQTMKQALDFIFGLVGDINDNYKYVIVDDADKFNSLNKTKIKYDREDIILYYGQEVYGLYTTSLNRFKSKTKGTFIKQGNIDISKNNAEDLDELYYTTLHETFHLFGVRDVYYYLQNERYHNTYINVDCNHNLKMIYPNDYKLLISLYAKDTKGFSEKEREDYINKLEQKIEDYAIKFYVHYQQAYKQSLVDRGFSKQDVEANTSYVQLENAIDVTFIDTISTKGIYKIRVKIKGDKYKIATYDENDKMLESCSGKAYNVGGQIFLQDVRLQNLKKGKQTYADLYIEMRKDNTKYYRLGDTLNNFYSAAGLDTEYYNQQNKGITQ